jgi:diguanylate cyclase (GGDEF)-like protein
MINVSTEALEDILATIDKALAMHELWRDRMHRTLVCRLPPEPACLAEDAHRQCPFGRWYYSPGNDPLRKLDAFRQVEAAHETMHDLARDLCTRLKAHWAISPREYDPFVAQIGEFRGELARLRAKVEETLHTIDPLTGAFRSEQLLPELRRAQEEQRGADRPYSLLLLRFDLEAVNHAHGHDKGDAILRAGLAAIRRGLAAEDRIYRYTGGEFVICLPGKDRAAAEALRPALLEGMTKALAETIAQVAQAIPVQYGIVALEPQAYLEQLIGQAAMATYTLQL